ncbi:MAG: glycosyltransferase [Thermoguttaceae bacterium]|nr:glycosyltransferase [Thermoguttaceae bacterium]MDW8039113.1 glycosyltransferase [Thermoguttaceae bacterium]
MGLRVLLTSHDPMGQGLGGQEVVRLARALKRCGYQLRVLLADTTHQKTEWENQADFSVRRLICRPQDPTADLPMPLPCFDPGPEQIDFQQLSPTQWQCYQEQFRQALHLELQTFDPQVIHCQYAWIHAGLAMETGLPYVVSVWGPELEAAEQDSQFQRLVEQSTVGAARLLVPDPAVAYRLPPEARRPPGRVVLPPLHLEQEASFGSRMGELYLSVLEAWFGA